MKNNIFKFSGELPQINHTVPIYRTSKTDEEQKESINSRIRKLTKIFDIKNETKNLGDTFQLQDDSRMLAIYPSSDSFWYSDEELFASENKEQSKNIPNAKDARIIATEFLEKNELLLPNAAIYSESYTTVAIKKDGQKGIDEYNTEIHVNFRYSIEDIPVFGPGAKSRVSLIDENTTSGVYHFWRDPVEVVEKRELLDPDLALELFTKNFRFSELKEESAKVVIREMEQGYFAMTPTAWQNFLIPVYRLQGTVSTKEFPKYDFDLHIVAVRYSDKDIRKMGLSMNGAKSIVF